MMVTNKLLIINQNKIFHRQSQILLNQMKKCFKKYFRIKKKTNLTIINNFRNMPLTDKFHKDKFKLSKSIK